MRVFERGSERWEIELEGSAVVTRTFVHDQLEDSDRKTHRSPLAAKWQADRLVAARVEDGYLRVAGEDYLELHRGDFEAALAEDPDDIDTYVVYGDWLAERGDAWGQLISVQHALETLPRFGAREQRDALEREQALLLFRNAARLWGWLGETIIDVNTQTYAFDLVQPTWFCGFVREVGLSHVDDRMPGGFDALVEALATLPVTSLLRSLTFTDDEMRPEHVASLTAQRWPLLQKLEVRCEFGFSTGGELFDARPLAAIFAENTPRLEQLVVIGATGVAEVCEALAASPVAAQMTDIAIERCEWTEPAIAALTGGRFNLASLRVTGSGIPSDARERLAPIARKLHVDIRAVAALEEDFDE